MPFANGAVQYNAAHPEEEPPFLGPPELQKARPIGQLAIPRFSRRIKCSTITTTTTLGKSRYDRNLAAATLASFFSCDRIPGRGQRPGITWR